MMERFLTLIFLVPTALSDRINTVGTYINNNAASEFLQKIEDPIVQHLVRLSYQTLCMLKSDVEGEFDLLFFFQIMESFLREREVIAKLLMGESVEDPGVWEDLNNLGFLE